MLTKKLAVAVVIAALSLCAAGPGYVDSLQVGLLVYMPYTVNESAVASKGNGGSLTFTRATASTYYASASPAVTTLTSGTPGVGLVLSGASTTRTGAAGPAGLHVHEQVIMLAGRNEELDNALWALTGTPIVTANDSSPKDPNSASTSETVQDDSNTVDEFIAQTLNPGAEIATYTGTVWARCDSAHDAMICVRRATGGSCTATTVCTQFTCSTTEWNRYSITNTNGTTCSDVIIQLKPTEGTGASLGTVNFWRPQLYKETQEYSLDTLQTTGASTSVNAVAASYSNVSPPDVGALCSWIWADNVLIAAVSPGLWDSTHDFRVLLTTGSMQFVTENLADNANDSTAVTQTARTWEHFCWTWNQTASRVTFYKNGASVAGTGGDQSWTAGGTYGSTMRVDTTGSGLAVASEYFLSELRLYNRELSAGDIRRLYNRTSGSH